MGTPLPFPSDEDVDRALDILNLAITRAGDGIHTLTLSVEGVGGQALAQFHFAHHVDYGFVPVEEMSVPFCELLAVAVKGDCSSGMILRSWGLKERVRGWEFDDAGHPCPLSGSELFNFYRKGLGAGVHDALPGDTDYIDAPVI
ncbi:hypothetical protein [Streptomyces sp. PTY087I2]|uniref:hypothetical protein n=1 Tax=Streptomyces sp. PTY087I2 TaxID=1819298 RepID=UPI00114C98FE|nr:hypothetical protein [Streptomyces sp. PTY087I2]